MLKAEQSAVINQANVHMVSLRGSEILYFSQFFSSFGTQAALISGFIIGNITQVPGLESGHHFLWIYLFWITSALTFCSAMHVLICSIFISVYGQGLALRGPTGSMVKAVEGMVIEQNSIVSYFGFTVFFLGLNLIGTCGIMMTFPYAVASSVITAGGMIAWYQACVRIYNRFKFTAPSLSRDWDKDSDDDDEDENNNNGDNANSPKALNYNDSNDINSARSNATNVNYRSISIEGYLTMGDTTSGSGNSNNNSNRNKKWTRKYFVLKRGYLFYYSDEDSYRFEPEQPINKRPISCTGYSINTEIMPTENNGDDNFTLILTPHTDDVDSKRIWEFRCDTVDELNRWKETFTAVFDLSQTSLNEGDNEDDDDDLQLDMIVAANYNKNNSNNIINNSKSTAAGFRNVCAVAARRHSIATVNSTTTSGSSGNI